MILAREFAAVFLRFIEDSVGKFSIESYQDELSATDGAKEVLAQMDEARRALTDLIQQVSGTVREFEC